MSETVIVDSGFLSAGLKVGQSAGIDTGFLDRYIQSNQFSGNKLVINDVVLGEFLDVRLPTAELLARIEWWNQNSENFELIDVDDPDQYTNNKGEHSIVDDTYGKVSESNDGNRIKIATVDDWLRKDFAKPLLSDPNFDPNLQIEDWGSYYRDEFMLNRSGAGESFDAFRGGLAQSGETGINGSLLKDLKSGAVNFVPEDIWSGLDDMRSGLSELQSEIGTQQFRNFSEVPEFGKAFWFVKSIEFIGVSAIIHDGFQTRQAIIEAIRSGDREKANELLGGYIGRAFGGAFLGALGAAAFVSLPGMILGALLGAYYGTDLGGALGEWLFGKTTNFGFDAIDALDALGDLLRHFRSDPLVLDLDGNGITLTALNASNTRFDVDGDGAIERVGWIDPNDGLLVLDANQNGQVDGIDELIGNTHVDGFDELASLDSNGDGKINQQDAEFSKLLVWRDVNGDGVSSSSELLTTAQAGITSFNLAYTSSGANAGGNVIARVGSYTLNSGAQRAMGSVQFAKDETVTRPTLPQGADLSEIGTLPNLGGYGPIADLRTSMFHDTTLKDMVLNLVAQNHDFDTFKDFLDGGFMDILYRWAGIDLHAAGETSVSLKEKLIEALTGESLFDLSASQQARIDDVFDSIIGRFGVGFLIQAADRSRNMLMVDLGSQLAGLDPSDAGYLDTVADLTDSVLSNIANLELPYEYLEKFSDLSLDPETGLVTGDFDAFAREFIKDQPSFGSMFVGASSGPPPAPPKTNGYIVSTVGSGEEVPEPEPVHPWQAWYEKEGSLLFNVAAAMGISGDYVKNVTGWQWLMKPAADVHGTSGNDVLNVVVSTITEFVASTGANGGTVYTQQSRQTRDQRLYGYEGNDELRGNDGVDTLVGGAGNDLLFGGSDSDMYVYSAGSGLDRITEESGAEDAVFFSSELKLEDLHVIRITGTNDLQLHFGDASQGIILTNQVNMGGSAVERFSFVGVGPLDAGDIATIYLRSFSSEYKDYIVGTAAGEDIFGLGGNDIISGLDGDDLILGGNGDDTLSGGSGNDRLEGGADHDVLIAGDGNDILIGGTGNDILYGNSGDDTFVFNPGDGQDTITDDGWGNDTIQSGAGILTSDVTVFQADNGSDLVLKFAGSTDRIVINDTMINGQRRIERVTFADGTVWTHNDLVTRSMQDNSGDNVFYGSEFGEALTGGAGNDILVGRDGNDVLTGGTGNDILYGNSGDDTFVFNAGDGQDTITDDGWGNDTIQLGVGILASDVTVSQADNGSDLVLKFAGSTDRIVINDTMINGQRRIERVTFVDGTVWTHNDLVARSMQDNSGDNAFYGSEFGETLSGGAGNDILVGRDGNDVLTGGTGNDILYGNSGDDTFVFNPGDGQDTITDDGWGNDTIQLGAGILTSDVTVSQADNGSDLVLKFAGSTDRIVINDTMINGQRRIERVTFVDGTVWTHNDLVARSMLDNVADNVFYGSEFGEVLSGGAGNDILVGRDGNDVLTGGTGNDILYGNSGDDIFVFNPGDGQDTITDDGWGNDTIQLGAGILTSDVTVFQADNGNDLVLTFAGSTDRIIINDTMTNNQRRIERVTFADGTVWTHNDLVARISTSPSDLVVTGTSSADTLTGGPGNDRLSGLAGSDILIGGAGNDWLSGNDHGDIYVFNPGDGQDIITDSGQAGDDIVQLGAGIAPGDVTVTQADNGNDLVLTFAGSDDRITLDNTMQDWWGRIEKVTFNDGTVWTHADLVRRSMLNNGGDDVFSGSSDADTLTGGAGKDVLNGRAGNDILQGGIGNDTLNGGDGGDTYVFNLGDGQDLVSDGGQGGEDIVQFGPGILPSDVTVVQADNGNDLILLIAGTDDRVTLDNTMQDWWGRIEKVTFNNGTVWTHADLVTRSMLNNGGDDVFSGSSDADTLTGGAGKDVLNGRAGNDILQGGIGNDILNGGDGGDTYVFNLGDGQDLVSDGGQGSEDIVQFGPGILPSDVTVVQADNGNDLILLIGGTDDRVTLDNTMQDWWGRIEKVTFNDGTVWTHADLVTRSMLNNGGDDVFSGSSDADTLTGGAGNDVLYGRSGSDILIGGPGNDALSGNDHGDIYVFNIGDGQDIINDAGQAGEDIVQLGTGIDPADVTVTQADNGNDLILTFAGSTDRITLDNTVTGSRIEKVTFADGTVWTFADMMARSQQPTEGGDIFYGYEGSDYIVGGNGDDQLYGGNGNDILSGDGGNDIISGGSGTDIARFAGEQASYSLVTSGGNVSIIDTSPLADGDDGKDTLTGIEKTEFKGGVQVGIASPIVLDLNGNGVSLVHNRNTKVSFDWDGDGQRDQTGWIGKDDGFLFIDRDGNGTVSDAGELSFTSDKEGAKSDLDGLRAFDSNGDGIFSSADDQFGQFNVWRDKNGNGRVDKKEILSLQAAGVASIDLTGEAVNQSWEWGENITVNTGTFTRTNGTVGSFSDVALSYDTASSQNAAINKAASQLSEAMAGFWDGRGIAALSKFEALAERRDSLLAVVHGEWR